MMKKNVVMLLLIFVFSKTNAQQYNNEWIDFTKNYYKFKVGSDTLCRINKTSLPALIQNIPAEQFQLWRNGEEVAIYTSVPSGILPANGYIEFWGKMNDGKPDKNLYKSAANQLSNALSLETDTATYFLTINNGPNLRYLDVFNNVSGNVLPTEPYFIYNWKNNFKDQLNRGKAVYFGTNVYSSSYDVGEWWSSIDIPPANPLTVSAGNLYAANALETPILNISVAGASIPNSFDNNGKNRTINVSINGTQIISDNSVSFMEAKLLNGLPALSLINTSNTSFTIADINAKPDDRIVSGFIDLQYPRQFNFDNKNNFSFNLKATAIGYFLEISNFNYGATAPVLYDITNQKRFIAVIAGNKLQFALPPAGTRDFVLVSEDATNVNFISNFTSKIFTDYTISSNQGDYIIISNKIITNGFPESGPVKDYADYRKSTAGGSYNAKVYDIDDLIDQFAFGIKNHPLSVKNFLSFARNTFSVKPKFSFLIGKAVSYDEARINEKSSFYNKLCLVPTFGWPASDNLLASENLEPIPTTPIGRLAAVSPDEVGLYLDKIKAFELQQVDPLQTIEEKAWQKTMVHVTGAEDVGLDALLTSDLNSYKDIIKDTLFGANVTSFNKSTTGSATNITDALMSKLFADGISVLNYFGHSSATVLAYNLNSPYTYENKDKYPVFLVNGCNAGNIFSFDTSRFNVLSSLSESYVLAKDRGAIAYVASSHFGVEGYLDSYLTGFYNSLRNPGYGKPLSQNITDGLSYMLSLSGFDTVSATLHAEENILHGDPAVKINWSSKPDFVIEDPEVIINPSFISIADNNFTAKCYFYNIGKATGDSVSVKITRQYPDGSSSILYAQKIKSIRYKDSVILTVPIVATRDKGENKISVSIDNDFNYDELSENNNTVTKSFFIYEDESRPIYPYNFAIVNNKNSKFYASTADPLSKSRQYTMEMDTTEFFNSSFKTSQTINSTGGLLEFSPGPAFIDSTVYYWRVAPVPTDGNYRWNTSSFVYLPGSSFGYNQSHIYQHLKSTGERIYIDSNSRQWTYNEITSSLTMQNGVFGFSGSEDYDFSIQINGITFTAAACLGHSIIFNLLDPITLKPFYNQKNPSTTGSGGTYGGFMNSYNVACSKQGSEFNFEFSYLDTATRRQMRDFMDWIPNGTLVTMRLIYDAPYDETASKWKADQSIYGIGNTFYDRLIQNGFAQIDSFSFPRTWVFNYKKNISDFTAEWKYSAGLSDLIFYSRPIPSSDTLGYIISPVFGPAKKWNQVQWRGTSLDTKAGDKVNLEIIGLNNTGNEKTLFNLNSNQQNFDISSIDVSNYPFLKLRFRNADSLNLTPYQLKWWRLLYDPVPEGAIAGNIYYTCKDTLALGQVQNFAIAFKNISDANFEDSIPVSMTVYNSANVATIFPASKLKKLAPGDTATVKYDIPTALLAGLNNLFVDINQNNTLPEQYHFNNFLFKNFLVDVDNSKPVMDVTFDGVHILNNDIISAQPLIQIKLKDESNYLLLSDTSVLKIKLIYPDGSERQFYYNTDTLKFTPATDGIDNTASVDFSPYLTTDGQYQLIVTGKDESGNTAGNTAYTVSFMVYNKPMISNLFNYPNPFTTSTAFVFTITGNQIPQNLRIQILTITGKIVKEITKSELGSLHIGRNITDYKWDGTDQYGQKLGNGVYLYRVITNLNGQQLDKFPTYSNDGFETNTDKYFTKGYGKMYLMR